MFLSFRYFYPKVSEFWTFCSDFSPFDSIEFALDNNYNHENLSLDLNNCYKNSLIPSEVKDLSYANISKCTLLGR